MSDRNQQPLFALSKNADGARKYAIPIACARMPITTLLTFDHRHQNSGTLDRYIYDTDNVGDLLVNGETTPKVKRIAKAAKTITKFAESFGKER